MKRHKNFISGIFTTLVIPTFLATLLFISDVSPAHSEDPPGYEWPPKSINIEAPDTGNCVQQTRDGGYVIVGGTNSDDGNLSVIKTNDNGTVIWQRAYDVSVATGNAVKQTEDGGYIIAGTTGGTGDHAIVLLKTDASGETDGANGWVRTYGAEGGTYDEGKCVLEVMDGYIVAGKSHTTDKGVLVFKVNATGSQIVWENEIAGNYATWVSQTSDGGFIVSSYATGNNGGLWRLSDNGSTRWEETYADSYMLNSVQQT